jgi:glycosyltransferase involved in cell wall biosynthesis
MRHVTMTRRPSEAIGVSEKRTDVFGYHSVGFFPPPWCGVSFVNDGVRRLAKQHGVSARFFDTAGPGLDGSLRTRLYRLARTIRSLAAFALRRDRKRPVYMSSSGGYAILYETVFSLLARFSGATQIIHHHSFRYVNRWFWPTALFRKVAGRDALHVVLSESMAAKFQSEYGPSRTLCLSNSVFLETNVQPKTAPRGTGLVAGLLSNLSEEKGLADFLALAKLAQVSGKSWVFRLAGPFAESALEQHARTLANQLGNIEILGPVLADSKREFYQSIDVFLFPTTYSNEAEPLVVLEALSYGVPVIAFGRGAIPEILSKCGTVISPGTDFVEPAFARLLAWESDRGMHARDGRAADLAYRDLLAKSQSSLQQLLVALRGE